MTFSNGYFTLHHEIFETDAAAVNDLLLDDDVATRDEEWFGCDTRLRVNARNVMFHRGEFNRVQQHRSDTTSLVIIRNKQAIEITRASQVGESNNRFKVLSYVSEVPLESSHPWCGINARIGPCVDLRRCLVVAIDPPNGVMIELQARKRVSGLGFANLELVFAVDLSHLCHVIC